MAGADDLGGEGYRLIPRLPSHMTRIEVTGLPVRCTGGVQKISYVYSRGTQYPLFATDGYVSYSLGFYQGEKPGYVRFGPFGRPDVKTNGELLGTDEINGKYYAYIKF